MENCSKNKRYLAITIRWVARIYGVLLAALILTIVIGEGFFYPGDGLPNPLTQPLPTAIELFAMMVMWIGCVLGWKWSGLGGLLIIAGITVFHIIEKRLLLMGAFPLFDLAGVLYLLSWWFGRFEKTKTENVAKMNF